MNNNNLFTYHLYMYFDILKKANNNYHKLLKLYGHDNRRKIENILCDINNLYKDIRKEMNKYYKEEKIDKNIYDFYKRYRLKA